MRQFSWKTTFFLLIFCSFIVVPAEAIVPDPVILSLISPQAQLISEMHAFPSGNQEHSFLLMTHDTKTDLDDFAALEGADPAFYTREIIFEVTPDINGALCTHSLLATGRYNREHIYKSALQNGASLMHYRKMDVLVIAPFLREKDVFQETRLFVILNNNIALFGSILNVEHEMDRYLDRSSADPVLLQQLSHLKKTAETWSMLRDISSDPQMTYALQALESVLPVPLPMGNTVEISIHYGSHIELEYDLSGPEDTVQSSAFPASTFLASANHHPAHGTVKLSRERYNAWIADIDAGNNTH